MAFNYHTGGNFEALRVLLIEEGTCVAIEDIPFHLKRKCWHGPEGNADIFMDCAALQPLKTHFSRALKFLTLLEEGEVRLGLDRFYDAELFLQDAPLDAYGCREDRDVDFKNARRCAYHKGDMVTEGAQFQGVAMRA
eukprot:1137272-Pelagomonas_calceolata.AAC.3